MMLALLVMGVSNTFGYTYRVLFESGAVHGGYRVTNKDVVSTADDALVLVSSQRLNSSTAISSVIEAREVPGNTAGFVLDNSNNAKFMGVKNGNDVVTFDGVIFITYNYNSNITPYSESDDNFNYSNIYTAIYGRNYGTYQDGSPRVVSQIYLGEKKVAISLINPRLQNATIPVSDPNGRTVVAIQRFGMTYETTQELNIYVDYCSYKNSGYHDTPEDRSSEYWSDINPSSEYAFGYDHRNEYLETVTFASGSQVASIGDYAFVCCTKLTEVNNIPSSLAFLGQAAFSACQELVKVDFPIRSELKTLRDWTFWTCYKIRRLNLPEGLIEIEGQQLGASMQYMTGL